MDPKKDRTSGVLELHHFCYSVLIWSVITELNNSWTFWECFRFSLSWWRLFLTLVTSRSSPYEVRAGGNGSSYYAAVHGHFGVPRCLLSVYYSCLTWCCEPYLCGLEEISVQVFRRRPLWDLNKRGTSFQSWLWELMNPYIQIMIANELSECVINDF